ncbi:hypothetical protein GGI21_006199 [Coemansia aciculifera]|nr:hypothetical protein GGI21_006199 [Coemansia aciculifera]
MQEVDRQANVKKMGGDPMSSSSQGNGPTQLGPSPLIPSPMGGGPMSNNGPASPPMQGPNTDVFAAARASGNGSPSAESAAQLSDLTTQVSRLSGNDDTRAAASAALHNQQVNFLQNTLLNSMAGGNRGLDLANALHGRRHRFLRRLVNAVMPRGYTDENKALGSSDILTGLVGGLLGKEGLVGHLLQGLGHVVEVLPQGLGETLKAVGSIAEGVTNDVFDILKLPKVDMSKVPEAERRIPYVAALPDWWYERNNLNATYGAQLHATVHDMIDGYNSIPGYVSPAVIHYVAKKYGKTE